MYQITTVFKLFANVADFERHAYKAVVIYPRNSTTTDKASQPLQEEQGEVDCMFCESTVNVIILKSCVSTTLEKWCPYTISSWN